MKRVVLLIDGGHLRAMARQAGIQYDPNFIEGFAKSCPDDNEELQKILYYDCAPYSKKQRLPVSNTEKQFPASDGWLHELAERDLFAVRRGQLKFRGWVPRSIPISGTELRDEDFKPSFEQKGIDMRIGIDIASISERRLADRILLVSADTDMIPAMKHARKAGLQVVLFQLPFTRSRDQLRPELKAHADFVRNYQWGKSCSTTSS